LHCSLQELTRLSQKFGENVLDATKKFEKLITDKKHIEGLPATSLGLAAQTAVSKVQHVIIYASWFNSSSLINCFLLYIIISGSCRRNCWEWAVDNYIGYPKFYVCHATCQKPWFTWRNIPCSCNSSFEWWSE